MWQPRQTACRPSHARGARVAAILALIAPAFAGPEPVRVETEHYRIHAEAPEPEAREFGRVLEAAWPHFQEFFGTAPKLEQGERLDVRFFASKATFDAGLRRDGITPPRSGGYYHPANRTAYLWRQPTTYFTRCLLLHEVTHQFHFLARTRNRTLPQKWYVEGLAEYLCRHAWDGEELRLGVLPAQSLEDYAAKSLADLEAKKKTVAEIVRDPAADRPLSWALVRWFATQERKAFDRLRLKLDRGAASPDFVLRAVGGKKKVERRLLDWLRKEQEPLKQIFNEWEGIGPGRMQGTAGPGIVSTCRVKGETRRFTALLEAPPAPRWKAGLLLHHIGNEDYTVAFVDTGKGILIDRRRDGRWERLHQGPCPAPETAGVFRLEAKRASDEVVFLVEGVEIRRLALPGSVLGLAMQGGRARYREIAWD